MATTRPKPRFLAGGDDTEQPEDSTPKRRLYACRAHNCPMPGTLFPGGTDSGICAWHIGGTSSDFPAITAVLRNWQCVVDAINAARTLANDPDKAGDVKAQRVAFQHAAAELAKLAPGWNLEPDPLTGETYGDWGRRLEEFLFARVANDVHGAGHDQRETPTVAAMRKALKNHVPTNLPLD